MTENLAPNIGFVTVSNIGSIQSDSVIELNNGDILLVGYAYDLSSAIYRTSTVRLHADGSLDTAYGVDGIRAYDLVYGAESVQFSGKSAVLQSDGKLLIAGNMNTNSSTGIDFGLLRLNTDGSIDESFIYPVGQLFVGADEVSSIAIQADGKILIAGTIQKSYVGPDGEDFGIIRLNSDGSLDTSFSDDGKLVLTVGTRLDQSTDVLVQDDGKIIIIGHSNTEFKLPNGIISGDIEFSVLRLNPNGTLDTTFSTDGKLILDVGDIKNADFATSAVLQNDGKLLVAGYSANGTDDDFSLVRFNIDGSLDTSFNLDGKVTVDISGTNASDFALDVVLQPDGKILIGGFVSYAEFGTNYAIARLNVDGSLDTSFSGDGKLEIHFEERTIIQPNSISVTNISGRANTIIVQDDGKILIGGSLGGSGIHDFGLVRINANGTIDSTFSNSILVDINTNITEAYSLGITAAGGSNNDILFGYDGNDILDGKKGADTMVGGTGDDSYYVDNKGDVITEQVGEGNDTVNTTISYDLSVNGDNVENITLLGNAALKATGNDLDNTIIGNNANNILDGGSGADNLIGGKGNDTYIVDNAGDTVTELINEGLDTVKASISYNLGDNVENLTLTDGLDIDGTGNALRNTIRGNTGNNTLDGGDNADKLYGGLGDDRYIVDLAQTGTKDSNYRVKLEDVVVEGRNAGVDTLELRGSFNHLNATTISLNTHLENLDASNTGTTKLDLTGNASNNIITGNAADNIINASSGDDTVIGGAGNDTLNGGAGIDVLTGGIGDDTFVFKSYGANHYDIVTDFVSGEDKIDLSGSAFFSKFSKGITEDMFVVGTAAADKNDYLIYDKEKGQLFFDKDGNGAAAQQLVVDFAPIPDLVLSDFVNAVTPVMTPQTIIGTAKADKLNGGAGNDVISGGAGNDILNGNAGDDILSGGTGIDTLIGGTGNDTFLFDMPGIGIATISDFMSGEDKIHLSENKYPDLAPGIYSDGFVQGPYATDANNHVIYNKTTGELFFDTDGTGNAPQVLVAKLLPNTELLQSDFVNALNTPTPPTPPQVIIGTDQSDTLLGGSADDTLSGLAGDDLLNGGLGADTMIGGTGNDTYIVDNVNDTIIEEANLTTISTIQGESSSFGPSISANGRYVIYETYSEYNSANTFSATDVFLKDMETGKLIKANDYSEAFADDISPDGRYILYTTSGEMSGDNNFERDVYLKDTQTGQTTIISTDSSGQVGNNGVPLGLSRFSSDGNFVTFSSRASNLIPNSTSNTQVFIKNLTTGETQLASSNSSGEQANAGSIASTISSDGRYISFHTSATNLSPADNTSILDVYHKDMQTGLITLVSSNSSGTVGNGNSWYGDVSDDGKFVVFESNANNLVNGDTNGKSDIFVKNIQTGTTSIVSSSADGSLSNGISENASISADGRYVVFKSTASNLVANDTNGLADFFVKDLHTGEVERITTNSSGILPNSYDQAKISADGRHVVFESYSETLVPNDNNRVADIFVKNLDSGEIQIASTQIITKDDTDTVNSSVSYKLPDNVENLNLTGAADINAIGNSLNNNLSGNQASNLIIGGQGGDTLSGGLGADTFKWELADKGTVGSPDLDTITDFKISQNDVLDLKDLLVGESVATDNLLNYLDITTDAGNTEVRISTEGYFTTDNYNAGIENARVTLSGVDLYTATGTSTEADLIQYLINNNHLIVDG